MIQGRLPRASTTRFILLIMMVCAASMFAAYWWLVSLRDNWLTEQNACVTMLERKSADLASFNGCIAGVVLRQEGGVLLGPAAVLLAALALTGVSVPVLLWAWGAATLPPSLADRFQACLEPVAIRRMPALRATCRGSRGQARVFGIFPRYWVVVDPLLVAGTDTRLAMVFRHELAHLQAGDVDRARLARSVWGVFFLFIAPPLVASIATQGGLAWAAVGLRLLILLLLIHLAYLSLLRAREYEADQMAAASSGMSTDTIAAALAARPISRRFSAFVPVLLRTHPQTARRAAALRQPARTARLSMLEFASIGVAAGVIFQELALALSVVFSSAEVAYWITGAVVGLPICVVTVSALWRHELDGPGPLSRWTVLASGALLGVGLLAGSQLSPRAATNWGKVQLTVSPILPSNLSIGAAGAGAVEVLTVIAAVGGALYALWVLAASRRVIAASPRRSPVRERRLFTALATGVLAIPAGTWFLLCRITANSVDGPQGGPIADLLAGRALLAGVAATVSAAAMALLVGRHRTNPITAVAWLSAIVLLPAALWYGGAAVRRAITPGPPIAATASTNAEPLLPRQLTEGTGPIQASIVCLVVLPAPPPGPDSPATWQLVGRLLDRTPDQALDIVGGTLIRAARAPSSAARVMAKSAWTAAFYRCNILLSVPSPTSST